MLKDSQATKILLMVLIGVISFVGGFLFLAIAVVVMAALGLLSL
ncbi:MAG: hypothetical protein Q7S03_01700 [bacterium]|nr:hypothetical protein [bacterium]